jgi:ABC-type antimicrobial peptide transport system permease subunit
MKVLYDRSMARAQFATVLLLIASSVALTIGAVGIYGVLAYVVTQRRKEFGVRLALGSTSAQVRGLVMRYGLTLVSAGIALGLLGAALTSRLVAHLLYGVQPFDPWTVGSVVAVLLVIATCATTLAGRRAGKVSPVEALRAD